MATGQVSYSKVLIRLLQGPLYQERQDEWQQLLSFQTPIADYFSRIGLALYVDEVEGLAFLRSASNLEERSDDSSDELPRLMRRAPLSYEVTILAVLLRERLLHFDANEHESFRLFLGEAEIIELLRPYLPERSDDIKVVQQVRRAISRVTDLGFLRKAEPASAQAQQSYEVMRILKAKMDADTLQRVKERLEGQPDE